MATCEITGIIVSAEETAVPGVNVYASCYDSPAVIQGTSTGIVAESVLVLTSSTGAFSLDLICNVKFTITIPEIGFNKTIKVPDSAGPISLWSLSNVFVTGDATETDPPTEPDW